MASLSSMPSIATPSGNPEFVRLDEKYKCMVCIRVLRDAMQAPCGHRMCEQCVAKAFEGKVEPIECPAGEVDCDMLTKSAIVPDPGARREIRMLLVYCTYKNDFGCNATTKWKDLEAHVTTCEYRPLECPNKANGCNLLITAKHTREHGEKTCDHRPETCKYCQESVPYVKMRDHVENVCNSVPMNCPYQCGVPQMKRQQLSLHLETCPKKPKECRFKPVGCAFKGNEDEVAQHELNDVNQHLERVITFTGNLDLNSLELRWQLQEVTGERDALRRKLATIQQEQTTLKTQVEALKTSNKELKMKMVSQTERNIHMERKSEDTAKKDVVERNERDVKAFQNTIRQLPDQLNQHERQGGSRGGSGQDSAAARPQDLTEINQKLTLHDRQFANLDIQMAELDLRFQILETASYDGTLLWKLRDYTRRKQEEIAGRTLSLYSQPFYTHRFGYKMCARVYLNGDGTGRGTHMSLSFVVMRGEFDNLLPWPFQQKVTMMLLDQETGQRNLSETFKPDPTSSSFKKPTSGENIAWGCFCFISHGVLETRTYIQDDTLFIKLKVDTKKSRSSVTKKEVTLSTGSATLQT